MNDYSYPPKQQSGQTVQQINPVYQQTAGVSPVVVRKSNKKWWIIGISLFLVVAIAGGLLAWYLVTRDPYSQETPEDALEKFRAAYNRFDYADMMEAVDVEARQMLWANMENAQQLMEMYDTVLGDELEKFRPQITFTVNNVTVETDDDGDKIAVFDVDFAYEGGIYSADPREIPEPKKLELTLREVDGLWYLTSDSYLLLTRM